MSSVDLEAVTPSVVVPCGVANSATGGGGGGGGGAGVGVELADLCRASESLVEAANVPGAEPPNFFFPKTENRFF